MTRNLTRLLRPKSIALFGGSWAENVLAQLQKSGFEGDIWPVNPKRDTMLGLHCYKSIAELPAAPDASFVGVNRELSIDVVRQLSEIGAGGATCFASGFLESESEGTGGADLQAALVEAAGDMPIIGPNCYGLINYLDNAIIWPDQHGGRPCDRGVAIIGQSSNILINMTMQKRGLPIAYALAAGNQAQTSLSELAMSALEDERVTAVGLYIEGFGDIREFEAMAEGARKLGKPIVAIKSGKSEKSRIATMTHTASLSGAAATSSGFLKRLGIVEVGSIAVFLETLKLFHQFGPLEGDAISSLSCSGGEAGLVSDMAEKSSIRFREFSGKAGAALKEILGPLVTIANPLDYHTFIWSDPEKLEATYSAVFRDGYDLNILIMDIPPTKRCDMTAWEIPLHAAIRAVRSTAAKVGFHATMPENLSEEISDLLMSNGIVPLHGMEEMILAVDAAIRAGKIAGNKPEPALVGNAKRSSAYVMDEAASKKLLAEFGIDFPKACVADTADAVAEQCSKLKFPVALKGLGITHKSELGAVVLDLNTVGEVLQAAEQMNGVTGFLAEEMVPSPVAELLIGVTRDATGLFQLTVGAGGVLTELLEDTVSLVLPTTREEVSEAITSLRVSKILEGYRGKQPAHFEAIVDAVMAVQAFTLANPKLLELDINPVMALPDQAVAVDALINMEI